MLKKFLGSLGIVVILGGCNQSALSVFGEDAVYQKGLEYTEVRDIVQSFETQAIINATYLNSTDPEKWDNKYHNFLVGIYISEDNENKEEQYLNNKKYTLTLNNKEYKKASELQSSSYLYNHIPLKNPHAKYYIISFEKDDTSKLVMRYKSITSGMVDLNFEAE